MLKEKLASLSGDDFDIMDANNNAAFKMQSSALSLAEKRILKNAQNQPVCSLKKKVCHVLCPPNFLAVCCRCVVQFVFSLQSIHATCMQQIVLLQSWNYMTALALSYTTHDVSCLIS